jgi:hypothetical protein
MPSALEPGNRVALVIGNAGYRHGPPLANPHNDSKAIAAALARLGFAPVLLHHDLGLIELGRALSDFQMRAEDCDMAVVYFAGHGLEIEGQNYLVPVDAELQHVGRMPFETIQLSHVLPVVGGAKTLQLVILDACRDNPFAGHMRGLDGTRSFGLGLSNIEPAEIPWLPMLQGTAPRPRTARSGQIVPTPMLWCSISRHLISRSDCCSGEFATPCCKRRTKPRSRISTARLAARKSI